MSKKTETKKLNKLAINKETVRDLDVNNPGEVRGGATANQDQTARIRCEIAPQTLIGSKCQTTPGTGCPR